MSENLTLKDQVYNYISEEIYSGNLKADEKINEKNIINNLKISRTPVREALIQLASEGYIENIPRRGFIVKHLDEAKIAEIYSLLGILDGFAARLAYEKLNEKDFRTMDMLIFGMKKAIEDEDYSDYYNLQLEFHDIYTNKCENEELIRVTHQLKKFFLKQSYRKNREQIKKLLECSIEEHQAILDMFRTAKISELEEFLKNVHWNVKHARLDSI